MRFAFIIHFHRLVVPHHIGLGQQLLVLEELFVIFLTYFLLFLYSVEKGAIGLPALADLDEGGAVLVGAVRRIDSGPSKKKIINSLKSEMRYQDCKGSCLVGGVGDVGTIRGKVVEVVLLDHDLCDLTILSTVLVGL